MPSLLGVSDLHVSFPENRAIVENLRPFDPGDWLIVAGDVAETVADVRWALALLADRFAKVIWVPGNHELWTHPRDDERLRGVARYDRLVEICRGLGVSTPEDPYPWWPAPDGDVIVAPLFALYDYSFRVPGVHSKAESLQRAYDSGIVCSDEHFLHPDPYDSIDAWCRDRVTLTQKRLEECDPALPTVLVNHWPTVRTPTDILTYPEFAQWCGTELTADWHVRYRAVAVVYGHLHIPRVIHEDGVRMEEVSIGYPREWTNHSPNRQRLRQILPEPT